MLVGDFQLKIRTSTFSSDFLTIPNRHRNTFTEFVGIPARSSSNPAHHHWCNIHIDALDTTKTPSTTTTACHDRRSRLGSSRNQTLNRTARIAEQVPTLHLRHSTTGASRIQQGSSHKNRKGPHPHTQSIIVSLSQHSPHPSNPRTLLPTFSTRPTHLPNLLGRLRPRRPCDQRTRQHRPRTALPPHLPPRMRRHFSARQLQPLPHVQNHLPAERLLPQKRHKRHGPPRTHHAAEPRARRRRRPRRRKPTHHRKHQRFRHHPTTACATNLTPSDNARPAHRSEDHVCARHAFQNGGQ
jgi:hypothetical protein